MVLGNCSPMAEGPSLAELGEMALLERLKAFAPAKQFTDDGALLGAEGPLRRVISSDALVEGVHFSEATTPAWAVGWRAGAANLSDLAAMGCRQVDGLTVALGAPGATSLGWVEQAYGGMAELLQRFGGVLLGGDCSRAPVRLLAITALGLVDPGALIQRGAGRAGDRLVVSGAHGLSGLGLALLQGEQPLGQAPSPEQWARAVEAHQRPQPRFDAVEALHRSRPAGQPWRVAGTDSSDGLRRSLTLISEASGCQAQLDQGGLPLPSGFGADPALELLCLDGGEDFELVLALDPAWAEAFVAQLPGARCIGWLGTAPGPPCWGPTKKPLPGGRGYEHFN